MNSADVIYSTGQPIDTSWRETFKADPELRCRAVIEFHRVHEIEHARANSMFRCPICHDFPRPFVSSTENP